jgi:hypothetical protein
MVLGQRLLELGLEVGRGGQDAVDESGGIRVRGHLLLLKAWIEAI